MRRTDAFSVQSFFSPSPITFSHQPPSHSAGRVLDRIPSDTLQQLERAVSLETRPQQLSSSRPSHAMERSVSHGQTPQHSSAVPPSHPPPSHPPPSHPPLSQPAHAMGRTVTLGQTPQQAAAPVSGQYRFLLASFPGKTNM